MAEGRSGGVGGEADAFQPSGEVGDDCMRSMRERSSTKELGSVARGLRSLADFFARAGAS